MDQDKIKVAVLSESDLDFALGYIASVNWVFAKTWSRTAPHEYTVRQWNKSGIGSFFRFVQLVRDWGYIDRFWGKHYVYLNIDGFKYWTMGAPIRETTVINRETLPDGHQRAIIISFQTD